MLQTNIHKKSAGKKKTHKEGAGLYLLEPNYKIYRLCKERKEDALIGICILVETPVSKYYENN